MEAQTLVARGGLLQRLLERWRSRSGWEFDLEDPPTLMSLLNMVTASMRRPFAPQCLRDRHCQVDGPAAQDHDLLVAIWPGCEGQNHLEGLSAYHNGNDACDEPVVIMGFATSGRRKFKIAVRSRDESVDVGPDKNRYSDRELLL